MRYMAIAAIVIPLVGCGNPGGISDADYAEYKDLGAPKVLFSCTTPVNTSYCAAFQDAAKREECEKKEPQVSVGYKAGVGVAATYNKILQDSKEACQGEFKVLDSKS